jgi:hypothetical protein
MSHQSLGPARRRLNAAFGKAGSVLTWILGYPQAPSGATAATTRANAIRFVCDRVDNMFRTNRYDVREYDDIVEIVRNPTAGLIKTTAIVHFRPVLDTVPEFLISKLASLTDSLDCKGVFISWMSEYSQYAIQIAEANEILLYRLNPDGQCCPRNRAAEDFDQRSRSKANPWTGWIWVALVLVAGAALYLGPVILFYGEKQIREAIGFSWYIKLVSANGVLCLGVLFSLIWGQGKRRAWRWPSNVLRSVVSFGLLVINIALIFACIYLGRSEQYPGSFTPPFHSRTQALYFSATTLTTVGYGDIHPNEDWARQAVLIELAVTISIVGVAFAGLGNRLASREVPPIG